MIGMKFLMFVTVKAGWKELDESEGFGDGGGSAPVIVVVVRKSRVFYRKKKEKGFQRNKFRCGYDTM